MRYFSDIHTSKESQLGTAPVTVADSAAITELRAALLDYPDDRGLLLCLAQELGQQLRYREAIEVMEGVVARYPDCITAYRRRAPRYFSTMQFARALADYERCAAATPDSLDVLYRLGITCAAMGDYPRTKEVMARCIELTENDGEMRIAAIFWYLAAFVRCHSEGEENLGDLCCTEGMEIGHHFAYHTATRLLLGRCTVEEALDVITDEVDDLDHSMILYGVYLHHLIHGDSEAAAAAMERLLARDTYWAGFAYIVALADHGGAGEDVPAPLRSFFAANLRVAIAFSGGVDSAYLLWAAVRCGCDVTAYYLHSAFQPQFEVEDAKRLAAQLGAQLRLLTADILANETVRQNPADRCYHCKRVIFTTIQQAALAEGYTVLLDGTNASDDASDRPGMRALAELSVRSPLRECGITKVQLREYSRLAGLFTWNKPAYACLATRVPTGRTITDDDLRRVEQGEAALMAMGFTDLRLRLTPDGCKLQLPASQLDIPQQMREDVYSKLHGLFAAVVLDLCPRGEN